MMTSAVTSPSSRPASATPNRQVVVRQIRFVTDAPLEAINTRRFTQPRHAFALEAVIEVADLPRVAWPEPTDHFWIVFVSEETSGDMLNQLQQWIAAPDRPDAVPTVVVQRESEMISWRPGRALVQCTPDRRQEILVLLTEFAFYEAELRALEQKLDGREAQAEADVAIAYRIQKRDQKHWSRIKESIECFSQMRLIYARLAPRLTKGSRTLPPDSQRMVATLFRQADVEDRLTALSDRLEAMEDLYEGANDRIADYRWYESGTRLEIAIIIILLIETVLIAVDLYIRSH
jgi:hypothetical protein